MPKTPYQRLLERAQEYERGVVHPKRVRLWQYDKSEVTNVETNWSLADLYYEVRAAKRLGFETVLSADADGLNVWFVTERPSGWEFV